VIERPVPGIPKSSLPGDEKTREIAVHLRIQEDGSGGFRTGRSAS